MVGRKKLTNDSLLVVLTQRVGLIKAIKVCSFIISWGYASEALERPPDSVEEDTRTGGA